MVVTLGAVLMIGPYDRSVHQPVCRDYAAVSVGLLTRHCLAALITLFDVFGRNEVATANGLTGMSAGWQVRCLH